MSCKEVLKSKNNSYTNTKHDSFNFIFAYQYFSTPKTLDRKCNYKLNNFVKS